MGCQPRNRRDVGDRMKLHLRERAVGGRRLRVLSLRPETAVVFGTNRFHDTWHVLSDHRGARLLAHLLWGLAFQKHAGTVFLLDEPHVGPNPFDASPSDPVLVLPAHLATPDSRWLAALRRTRRHLGASDRTVRWQSGGLERAEQPDWRVSRSLPWKQESVQRREGFLCYSAPPEILRSRAIELLRMASWLSSTSYTYLADEQRPPDGEIQIFAGYRQMCSAAAQARRQILGPKPAGEADIRIEDVWWRSYEIRREMAKAGIRSRT